MGDSCGSSSSSLFDVGFRESLFQSLTYNDLPRLKQLLSTLDLRASLDIVNLFDNNGLTLLHRAVSINSMEFTRYIIRFIKRQLVQFYKAKKIIREKQKLKFTKDENIEGSRAQIVKEANEKVQTWVNVDTKNSEGMTALLYSAYHGNVQMIEILIRNGADIWAKSKAGMGAMHIAA